MTLSRRHDAKLRGEEEPPSVAARRASLALSPNLGGSTTIGLSSGGVAGVPPGTSPGGRRKSSTTSHGVGGRRRSSAAPSNSPLVDGVGSPEVEQRSPSLAGNPLGIGTFGVAMENEMQRRESEGLTVAFEEDDDGAMTPENDAPDGRRESHDLIEGLDAEAAQDELEQLGAPLKHQDGLGISV